MELYQKTDYCSWSAVLQQLALVLLAVIGLFYIYSAGYVTADYPVRANWQRQMVFIAIGFVLYAVMIRWDNRSDSWQLLLWGGYALSLAGLLAVLSFGKEIGGARRWLAIGGFYMQPAEFARIFTLLAFCQLLFRRGRGRRWLRPLLAGVVVLLPVILIAVEPSLGNAASLFPCLLGILAVRFLPPRLMLLSVCLSTLLLLLAGGGLFWLRTQDNSAEIFTREVEPRLQKIALIRPYHLRRLKAFVSPLGGWNERQAVMSVAGGGLYGKGYLNGTMKSLGYLPRTVAPSDFIFSVIAEEGGFLFGTLPVICLYILLLIACLRQAALAADPFDNAVCTGLTLLCLVHICVGIGMTVRLIPIIGLPLPLLSYGGSFTLAFLLGMGIISGTRRHQPHDLPTADSDHTFQLTLPGVLRLRINNRILPAPTPKT